MTDSTNNGGDGKGWGRDDELMESITQALGDPEEILQNPFAAMQKLMANPSLMQQLNGLYQTPAMREQIEQGLKNPMFQEMMRSNPQLDSLYQKAQAMQQTQVPSPEQPPAPQPEREAGERIDWMQPPHTMQSFIFPSDAEFVRFNDLFVKLGSEKREIVEILASKRLSYHLPVAKLERLEDLAQEHKVTGLDLMCNVAGFLGDLLHALSEHNDFDLSAPMKLALGGVRRRSGFPVASYITQLLLCLEEHGSLDVNDWENFAWALSSNPQNGVDGNFVTDWAQVRFLVEVASASDLKSELLLAVIVALLQWDVLKLDGVEQPLATLFGQCGAAQQHSMLPLALELLTGGRFFGVGVRKSSKVQQEVLNYLISRSQFEALLALVRAKCEDVWEEVHEQILRKLDLLWSSLDSGLVNDYLQQVIEKSSTELVKKAISTGFSWEPELYGPIALAHRDEKVVAWAKAALMRG